MRSIFTLRKKIFSAINKNQNLIFILATFFIWRVATLLLWYSERINTKTNEVIHHPVFYKSIHPFLYSWVQWDSGRYYEIITLGYKQAKPAAFFPLYPTIVFLISRIFFFLDIALVGILLSHVFLLVALFLFFKLVRLDYTAVFAQRAVFYLLILPTSLFLYTIVYRKYFSPLICRNFLFC